MANNKYYGVRLGAIENGSSFTGLSPTMSLVWALSSGTTLPGVSITEVTQNPGFYYFQYGATSPVMFRIDFGAGLAGSLRYVEGLLDPIQSVDQSLTNQGVTLTAAGTSLSAVGVTVSAIGSSLSAMGSTLSALGSSLAGVGASITQLSAYIGTTASSFGSTASDPSTVFGYLRRVQENLEGNSTFTKATGVFDIYSRGSSTLLIEKTITQSTVSVTKT
jgi:hypothetical protein